MRLPTPLAAVLVPVLVVVLMLPATALASSVSASEIEYEGLGPKGESTYETHVSWRADPGEANRLDVRWDEKIEAVVLRDPAAPIRALEGCAARADGSVACASPIWLAKSILDGGDGDDALRVENIDAIVDGAEGDDTLTAAGSGRTTLGGGPGADTLHGGPEGDRLEGGAGADTLDGGDGADALVDDPPAGPYAADRIDGGPGGDDIDGLDTILYERPGGVAVDLRAGTGGAPGEGDRIVGIEGVIGGSAADELRGSDDRDSLGGGRGADLIEGRGGKDLISADDPRARLFGGAGNDVFYTTAAIVSCGAGRDFVRDPGFATVVDATTCERITDSAFAVSAPRRAAGALRMRLRGVYYLEEDRCGAFVAIRPAGGGRLLARRFVQLPEGRLRRVRLVALRPLPARLQIEVRGAYCSNVRPSLRSVEGFEYDPPPRLRFSARCHLCGAERTRSRSRGVAAVG